MINSMRRASVDTFEKMKDVTSSLSSHSRDRRFSLTVMNCVWARSTETETIEPISGEIFGQIPKWLDGSFYRIGPGVLQVGDLVFDHPFDMLSVIQKFDIFASNSVVTYRNKIVDSKFKRLQEQAQETAPLRSRSSEPFKTQMKSLRAKLGRKGHERHGNTTMCDNCIDNFCFFGSNMYILSDIPYMVKICPDSLNTINQCDIEDYAPVLSATCHPVVEENGTIWNMGISYNSKDKTYEYTVLKYMTNNSNCPKSNSDLDNVSVFCRIPSRHSKSPSYFHSFGISKNYILFIEQPLYYQSNSSSSSREAKDFLFENGSGKFQNLKWKGHENVHFIIWNKKSGKAFPMTFSALPFFFFHLCNTFENEEGHLVVDILAYNDAEILNDMKFSAIEKRDHVPAPTLQRFILPIQIHNPHIGIELLGSEAICSAMILNRSNEIHLIPEKLVPESLEFPRINYAFSGLKNRFIYGLGNEFLHPTRILKIDTDSRDVAVWKEAGHFVSEPIFISRTETSEEEDEDDGVILFTLLNTSPHNTVQLIILNAKNFDEIARVRFRTHGDVTEGFHGIFVKRNSTLIRY